MKKILVIVCCITMLMVLSCKSKSDKTTVETETVTDANESADHVVKESEQSNARWEERKAKGDTTAMPYKELQAYLPETPGYTRQGGPKGSQMNAPGMGSWSQAEQEYENGDKRVTVSIFDYNSARQAFTGLTAMYGMGFSFEDDTKKQAPIELGKKGVAAYATTYKTEPRGELVMVVADRFIIHVKSDGEGSEDFLKSVANNMKLDEMASK